MPIAPIVEEPDLYVVTMEADKDYDGLITKAISRQQILLPIWQISKQQVIDYSPPLVAKVARNINVHEILCKSKNGCKGH